MPRNKTPSGDLISVDELDDMVEDIILMEAYCTEFRRLILRRLEAGDTFENARMEPKRPSSKWSDEEGVLKLFAKSRLLKRDEFEPRKLMPCGAFRKAMKDELKRDKPKQVVLDLLDLIETKSSGFNLVLKP